MLQEGPNLLGNRPENDGEIQYLVGKFFYFTCLFNAPAISNMDI
jgi:hypothetical protein